MSKVDTEQRNELIQKVEREYGIAKLFNELGLQEVTTGGNNVYCICPFHTGADNPTGFAWSNGFGYCFTNCHKSYSLADIVMKAKQYSYPEALVHLADLVGVDVDLSFKRKRFDGDDNKAFLSQGKRVQQVNYNIEILEFDKSVLSTFEPKMHRKLREEGFDPDVREYFDLGFCTSGYLENRITIPVDDYDGNVITVSGKSVLSEEDIEFGGIKKYLIYYNTDKSKTLYNISRALPYVDLLGTVYVVEGFKSVWRLHQWGIDNVVATMGSALSEDQVLLLLKMNAKIITCGDNDKAGKKLNQDVVDKTKKYADVCYLDMSILKGIRDKDSPADIERWEWDYLCSNLKEVM